MNSIILYNASDFWRKHRSIGRFPDLAQLPFSKRSMNMCMSIEQRCIYVDRGKLKYSEKDLFQCHCPLQISRAQAYDCDQISAVKGRKPTKFVLYISIYMYTCIIIQFLPHTEHKMRVSDKESAGNVGLRN